jgi:osmotically-inducible protein OsmY
MSAWPAARENSSHDIPHSPVVEAAHRALQSSPYWAVRQVRCGFHEGQLTLHGHVPTFYLLQVAQELVCRLPGVEEVENRIVVDPECRTLPSAVEPSASPSKLSRRLRVGRPLLSAVAGTQ